MGKDGRYKERAARSRLEFGDFGEVEIADLHGGDDHFEGFFAGGADGGADMASTFCSISMRDWLKRKLRTAPVTLPFSTRNRPSRVMPVMTFS